MRTMIAIPSMSTVLTPFVRSLVGMRIHGEVEFAFTDSSLVYDARNTLCEKAVKDGFDRILWLDTDMVFPVDTFAKLHADLDTGKEFVCGLYTTRREPIHPVIYDSLSFSEKDGPQAHWMEEIPKDKIFEIAACGFGCVMMSTKLVEDIADQFGRPFTPIPGFGEDLSFCIRASQMGRRMFCDPTIMLGHIGYKTYVPEAWRKEVSHDL